jgi:UDP-3-O-[3-hydroxymyristoyl] glucosamine N-acyltransferase
MAMTASEWAHALNGTLEGTSAHPITGAATLEDAQLSDLSFLANAQYRKAAETSSAGLILLDTAAELVPQVGTALLRVPHPYQAWAEALRILAQSESHVHQAEDPNGAWIHPTAQVDPSATVHPGVWIGAQCVIGSGCILYPGARLYPKTRLGKGCIVHANAVLGSDGFGYTPPAPAAGQPGYGKIPHLGWVELADHVEIGANTTIDRGVVGATRVGTGTKIDNLCHLAHNVQIGDHCVFAAQVGVAGSTKIGNYVRVGGQVGFNGHIHVGDFCEIGAQSGVTKSLPAKSVVWGTPAMPMPQFLRAWAKLRSLSK